jgi:hypothetical protein
MKKKGVCALAVALAALLLCGCGEEPYTLTEQEQTEIANYSAHIISKFNRYQADGLTYVHVDDTETEEVAAEESVESTESAGSTESTGSDALTISEDGTPSEAGTAVEATLDDVFGSDAIHIACSGTRIDSQYVEESYYALDADSDKLYLIVDLDVTNNSTEAVDVDNLSRNPSFVATVNGEYTSRSEITILNEDFSTMTETIEPGATVNTVLLFQVPETVTEVQTLVLEVEVDGQTYQITI